MPQKRLKELSPNWHLDLYNTVFCGNLSRTKQGKLFVTSHEVRERREELPSQSPKSSGVIKSDGDTELHSESLATSLEESSSESSEEIKDSRENWTPEESCGKCCRSEYCPSITDIVLVSKQPEKLTSEEKCCSAEAPFLEREQEPLNDAKTTKGKDIFVKITDSSLQAISQPFVPYESAYDSDRHDTFSEGLDDSKSTSDEKKVEGSSIESWEDEENYDFETNDLPRIKQDSWNHARHFLHSGFQRSERSGSTDEAELLEDSPDSSKGDYKDCHLSNQQFIDVWNELEGYRDSLEKGTQDCLLSIKELTGDLDELETEQENGYNELATLIKDLEELESEIDSTKEDCLLSLLQLIEEESETEFNRKNGEDVDDFNVLEADASYRKYNQEEKDEMNRITESYFRQQCFDLGIKDVSESSESTIRHYLFDYKLVSPVKSVEELAEGAEESPDESTFESDEDLPPAPSLDHVTKESEKAVISEEANLQNASKQSQDKNPLFGFSVETADEIARMTDEYFKMWSFDLKTTDPPKKEYAECSSKSVRHFVSIDSHRFKVSSPVKSCEDGKLETEVNTKIPRDESEILSRHFLFDSQLLSPGGSSDVITFGSYPDSPPPTEEPPRYSSLHPGPPLDVVLRNSDEILADLGLQNSSNPFKNLADENLETTYVYSFCEKDDMENSEESGDVNLVGIDSEEEALSPEDDDDMEDSEESEDYENDSEESEDVEDENYVSEDHEYPENQTPPFLRINTIEMWATTRISMSPQEKLIQKKLTSSECVKTPVGMNRVFLPELDNFDSSEYLHFEFDPEATPPESPKEVFWPPDDPKTFYLNRIKEKLMENQESKKSILKNAFRQYLPREIDDYGRKGKFYKALHLVIQCQNASRKSRHLESMDDYEDDAYESTLALIDSLEFTRDFSMRLKERLANYLMQIDMYKAHLLVVQSQSAAEFSLRDPGFSLVDDPSSSNRPDDVNGDCDEVEEEASFDIRTTSIGSFFDSRPSSPEEDSSYGYPLIPNQQDETMQNDPNDEDSLISMPEQQFFRDVLHLNSLRNQVDTDGIDNTELTVTRVPMPEGQTLVIIMNPFNSLRPSSI